MARKPSQGFAATNGSTQAGRVNRDIPPQSTIAAQIVHNRANVTREGPESQELFGRLLQEYLNDPIAEETSLETNAQLIRVVAEAGLDAAQKGDIFAPDAGTQRAVDSLRVLQLTVQRNPRVVFFNGHDTSADGPNPPLILWLLPKVLLLAGKSKVHDQVVRLLVDCVHLTSYSNQTWRQSTALLDFIRGMISDALQAVPIESPSQRDVHGTFSLTLPSPQSLLSLWSKAQHSVVLPRGYEIAISSPYQALQITSCLLAVDLDVGGANASLNSEVFHSMEDQRMWSIERCQQLVSSCAGISSHWQVPSLETTYSNLCDIVTKLVDWFSNEESIRPILKMSADVLHLGIHVSYPDFQDSLAGLILHLLQRCLMPPNTFRDVAHEFISNFVLEFVRNEMYFPRSTNGLQCALVLWIEAFQLIGPFSDAAADVHTTLRAGSLPQQLPSRLVDSIVDMRAKMKPASRLEQESDRPAKRIRLESTAIKSWREEVYSESIKKATAVLYDDGRHLDKTAVDDIIALAEEDRCRLLEVLAFVPCSGCSTSNGVGSLYREHSCTLCDNYPVGKHVSPKTYWNDQHPAHFEMVLAMFHALVADPDFKRSKRQRLLMARLMQRVFAHISDPDDRVLHFGSPVAEWCLRSLQSSVRELRIAAGQAVVPLIDGPLQSEVLRRNRRAFVEFLRELSIRGTLSEQETLILAWGLVGRHCGPKEVNLTLLQLVDYLGHPQPLICALAAGELSSLAEQENKTVGELFRPFWKSIAPGVVQDIFSRPQKAQQLADLLSISVNDLLLLTQVSTVPYLTLTNQKATLERIAAARGPDTPVRDLWLQPARNVGAVTSVLLLHYASDPLNTITEVLTDLDPSITESDIENMIVAEPIATASEILNSGGDKPDDVKGKILPALKALATIVERKASTSKSSKSKKTLESFLDSQLLGIMAHFTELIDTPTDRLPITEKQQALQAVNTLITISKAQIGIALPQVRATLQSAFASPALADQAFFTWVTLLNCVGNDDIESILDETFAIIVENWPGFGPETQKFAHDTVAELLKRHNTMIRDRVEMIPSMAGIELLRKFDSEITRLKSAVDPLIRIEAFCQRCQDENSGLVRQCLLELVPFLAANQGLLHESSTGQQPSPVIPQLYRVLLDTSLRYKETHGDILDLCGQCLGILGSIDPNKVEATREKRELLMLSNFDRATEVIDFAAYMLESVLIPAFHAASSGKTQSYLAYVMQELLKSCGFRTAVLARQRPAELEHAYRRWLQIPDTVRFTLQPYLTSKYFVINSSNTTEQPKFPIFKPQLGHGAWLRSVVFNLLLRPNGDNAKIIFPVLSRVIWGHDLTIAASLLPFVFQNAVIGGTEADFTDVLDEISAVLLHHDISSLNPREADNVKQCSENVFQVLDYLSRWLQEKRRIVRELASGSHRVVAPPDFDQLKEVTQISRLEKLLAYIPADGISTRAMQCGAYARALFHWEQYIREFENRSDSDRDDDELDAYYKQLQDIYAHIEEPDGIEGISAQLHILDPEQQVLEHKRAGRWTAVQSWYELALAEDPTNEVAKRELLSCLKASGQHEALLNLAARWTVSSSGCSNLVLPFTTQAAWLTGKWDVLERLLDSNNVAASHDFDVGVGRALLALRGADMENFESLIRNLRSNIMHSFSSASTASLANAHSHVVKLHALYEIAAIGGLGSADRDRSSLVETLERRLALLGSFTDDKQYLLGLRRAAMELSDFTPQQIAGAWLTTSRLARKGNALNVAYDAVLHATKLHDDSATIEHSRILWKDGQHRKAINNLKGAIEAGVFQSYNVAAVEDSVSTRDNQQKEQNPLVSKTQLLLAKWLDQAGLIKSMELLTYYQRAQHSFNRSQSPTYYLGKYYNKLLDAEAALPKGKQSEHMLTGELIKLAIDNYLRSMAFGSKYYYETVPKLLTLWLDFGANVAEDTARRLSQGEQALLATKVKRIESMHKQMQKYIDRLPPYIWYTALSQMMSRINHPHPPVADFLASLIKKVVASYPQQAMWSLLAVAKSKDVHKQARANTILLALRSPQRGSSKADLNTLVSHGQRLTDALLGACEKSVESRASKVSLHRDLDVSPKLAPCPLVVPIETTMIASLPSVQTAMAVRQNKPFPANAVTIASFQDDVLVLSSLQRPRKITLRGSDGQLYGLLCKPKDDLRKDNRLMEFNALISRSLKRDIESSKRRLYIRTYAVTPLNEECGAIEWVDGLKPVRDIILAAYKSKGVRPDYGEIRQLLDRACADHDHGSEVIFTNQILPKFAPILYEWFIETFPEPETWFASRLRYTRSAAVMSIVGHVLGLGDRHGENILLEEGTGGVFHVDFNCLFDKGLTFEKPELVPFRLTHNMIDAMGSYGYEGPFRTACELTLKCLRQYQDTLMTIMETFLYDPTADFVGKAGGGKSKKDKSAAASVVPETPKEVLESVRAKIKGLLPGENVPLSVDGYVDALIRMAVDPRRLSAMYIGWCAFF